MRKSPESGASLAAVSVAVAAVTEITRADSGPTHNHSSNAARLPASPRATALDRAVRQVSHPAEQIQLLGAALSGIAKTDPLHPATDDEMPGGDVAAI